MIAAKIDEIIAANEKRLRTTTAPPSIIDVANDGAAVSVRSASSASSVVTEVNERMSLFTSILFSLPVEDADGTLLRLVPASPTDEVKEIFAESSSISEQARRVQEQFISLAEDVGKESTYFSRQNRFPRLSLTNILFMLQSHCHRGNMDSNMESLRKS